MNVIKATQNYESWIRGELEIFEDDLVLKSQLLAKDPFTFLRGTFYRWMQVFPDICKKAAEAPVVLSVGDLHASNFGTWRNADHELVWGINDFDEAAFLPYTQDLIRLATSVELASETQRLKINLEEACDAILDGYRSGLEKGGRPFLMDQEGEWLQKAYGKSELQTDKYWEKLDQCPNMEREVPVGVRSRLEAELPSQGMAYRLLHRQAGVGSLGRPRYTALAMWQDGFVAVEVKALIPSAALWVQNRAQGAVIQYEEILARAVRSLDPLLKADQSWVIRGLGPDRSRIGLSELGPERDETRMMRAMGRETANIHLGTRSVVQEILKDLKDRRSDWLKKSAQDMVEMTIKDWKVWKSGDISS
jgi:uncharacterized protein (DUF2252 family)